MSARAPLSNIGTILMRHAEGPDGEVKLAVAILTRAIADLHSPSGRERASAERFIRSEQWDSVASFISISGEFARGLARQGGWLR